MKSADVVIGSNWGDEGKGLITDFLASSYGADALVVRFCGGAQAGHTVTTPFGERHVFNHFGSGSFCHSATYLSRFFVCNPIIFLAEAKRLATFGLKPRVYIDPAAPVTTPYDMMINQIIEEKRGSARHGSCGVGFGETIERQQRSTYALCFADLFDQRLLKEKLHAIRSEWVPQRLHALGIPAIAPNWLERIGSDGVFAHFVRDVGAFLDAVRLANISVVQQAEHVVFEGAQGLLLDQDHKWFPHVTRSSTGLKNAATLAREAGIGALNAHYITRAYATRHGAGPMPHELAEKPYEKIVDLTNIPNPHQGSLRFGWLDLDLLQETIQQDLARHSANLSITPTLVMSCVDQLNEEVCFVQHNAEQRVSVDEFLTRATQLIRGASLLTSHGPTRATIKPFFQTPQPATQGMRG